jgi:hypothetical protein
MVTTYNYTYDSSKRCTSTVVGPPDTEYPYTVVGSDTEYPENKTTTIHYNALGLVDYDITPKGYRKDYSYDNNGKLIKTIIDSSKKETTLTLYDEAGGKKLMYRQTIMMKITTMFPEICTMVMGPGIHITKMEGLKQ